MHFGIVMMAAAVQTPVDADAERQVRQILTSEGFSPAGIETLIAIRLRGADSGTALQQRVRTVETAIQTAIGRRPIDPAEVEAAFRARESLIASIRHEQVERQIEEVRRLSPADRIVLLDRMRLRRPGEGPLPIAPPAPPPPPAPPRTPPEPPRR